MKYLNNFRKFEAVIIPTSIENNSTIRSFEDLIEYGVLNNFDAVNYDDFYNSLSDADKRVAPPRQGVPFFALFHPENKKPMFVLVDRNAPRFIPNFKEIVDDIIRHEKIHAEQVRRKGDIEYSLPSPTDRKSYFSNKEEIMAFSWTIANGLSKRNRNIESAMTSLDEEFVIHSGMGMRPEEHKMLWVDIKRYCDEIVLKRYRKYIYMYLDKILNKEEDNIHTRINKK
jgi:hypothetical protein